MTGMRCGSVQLMLTPSDNRYGATTITAYRDARHDMAHFDQMPMQQTAQSEKHCIASNSHSRGWVVV